MEKLISYDYYRGNVAELEDALERALLIADEGSFPLSIFFWALCRESRPGV